MSRPRQLGERQGRPVMAFASAPDWEAWLASHHATSDGVWLQMTKKGTGDASVTHAEALEIALCYGWIDGQTASVDMRFWMQRFSRRGPKSIWSRINRNKAEALIAEGRMTPSGLAQVEAARRDGRWEAAYAPQRTIEVPADLQAQLEAKPRAMRMFLGLDSKNRYAILFRIHGAKKAETRARRIAQFVAMLAQGKVIYPQTLLKPPPKSGTARVPKPRPR